MTFPFPIIAPRKSVTLTQIASMSSFAHIGDMTGGGGLNGIFDGNTSTGVGTSTGATDTGYAGQNWGSGVSKNLGQVKVYRSGSNWSGSGASGTLTVYGKATAPGSRTDGTVLATAAYNDTLSSVTISVPSGASYQYHWVGWAATTPAGGYVSCAECEMWEWI